MLLIHAHNLPTIYCRGFSSAPQLLRGAAAFRRSPKKPSTIINATPRQDTIKSRKPANNPISPDVLKSTVPMAMKTPSRQYPLARRIKRHVHLHIGPTNSGKSYTALNSFKSATTGFYAGPLRMLAREIYDRMEIERIPCNLITGDEIMEKEGAGLNSGTVEMMDLSREMEVAVIDEIQMISDPNRGWAWTRALLGVRAEQVHLCGDPSSEDIVSRMLQETGDILHVHRYERLSPLEVMKTPLVPTAKGHKKPNSGGKKVSISFSKYLQPGDCLVSFSKKNVQSLRDKIVQAHNGTMCCSIIYGSLPPETRAEQARQFNDPSSDVKYLVASDAIGMGLNLGIKRIIFSTLNKFDGNEVRQLDVSEIKQIAGRAGRFRTADGAEGENGLVTALDADDLPTIRNALAASTPSIKHAVIMPSNQSIRSAMFQNETEIQKNRQVFFSDVLTSVLLHNNIGRNYCRPRLESTAEVAKLFDTVRNLSIDDRMILANAPVPSGMPLVRTAFKEMCKVIGNGQSFNAYQLFPQMIKWLSTPKAVGQTLEILHKTLTLFLWLSYRFPCNFVDRTGATDLKKLCESRFAELLRNSRKKLAPQGKAPNQQTESLDVRKKLGRKAHVA